MRIARLECCVCCACISTALIRLACGSGEHEGEEARSSTHEPVGCWQARWQLVHGYTNHNANAMHHLGREAGTRSGALVDERQCLLPVPSRARLGGCMPWGSIIMLPKSDLLRETVRLNDMT